MLYKTGNTHGGDVYSNNIILDYSVSLNPLGMPDVVAEAIKSAASVADRYPDPYCRELVNAIACKEGVSADYILCSNGGAELIYAYCSAAKPERPAVCVPSFSEYETALQLDGKQIIKYTLDEKRGFLLDEGVIDTIRQQSADLLFLCNPNNPDGRLIPDGLLDDILAECNRMGCAVFLDECFLELSDGNDNSKVSLIKKYPGLFILKAFTKSFSCAGVRLGYGICSDKMLLSSISRRLQPWNVSVPAQQAGLAALREEGFVRAGREIIKKERIWLSKALTDAGLQVYPSEANYMLIRVPDEGESEYSRRGFGERLLEKGILIRSCENFEGLGKGWYRISIKRRHENETLLRAVRDLL